MAGTAVVYPKDAVALRYPSYPLLLEITADIRLLVDDIEILRSGLDAAEDWILEVNTDLATRVLASKASVNLLDNATGVGEETGEATASGAVLGDFVEISLGVDIDDYIATAYVTTASTVTGWCQNESGGNINLDSTTVYYLVTPFAQSAIEGTITASVLDASAFDAAGDMDAYNITIS